MSLFHTCSYIDKIGYKKVNYCFIILEKKLSLKKIIHLIMLSTLLHDNLWFRRAEERDKAAIWEIIKQAKAQMKSLGSKQWSNEYPTMSAIEKDIELNEGVVICEDNEVVVYGVITFKGEPVYDQIKDKWSNQLPYLTVHRLAVNDKYKRRDLALKFMEQAQREALKQGITNFRVDTNYDNDYMLRIFGKMGFKYVGEVIYRGKQIRKAYEKSILPPVFTFGREGYTLREIVFDDATSIFNGLNKYREDMRQWLPFVDQMQKLSDEQTVIENFLMPKYAVRNLVFAIEKEDRFCGMIGISNSDFVNDRLEIGYWLLPPHRGKGVMTCATRYLCRWLFAHRPVNRIQIKCSKDNHASNAIPRRLGFQYEGTEREGQLLVSGEYTDINVYSLLKKDIIK